MCLCVKDDILIYKKTHIKSTNKKTREIIQAPLEMFSSQNINILELFYNLYSSKF